MVSLPLEAFIKGLTQGDLCQAVHRDAVFVLQNLASHRWLSQFNSDTINKNEFYFPKIQKSLLLRGLFLRMVQEGKSQCSVKTCSLSREQNEVYLEVP